MSTRKLALGVKEGEDCSNTDGDKFDGDEFRYEARPISLKRPTAA